MTIDLNNISAWQYDLPDELIASRPAARHDEARLMVVERASQAICHHRIRDLPDLLQSGDRVVFNDTQVLPARLFGYRTKTLGRWEGLFLDQPQEGLWRITGQTRGKLRSQETLTVHPPDQKLPHLCLTLEERLEDGSWLARVGADEDVFTLLNQFGTLPLPPYIGRKIADAHDRDRYQTVFAERPGAIAAPTAGLHFTRPLLDSFQERGIRRSKVTLHVGIGTYRPVCTEKVSDHRMHAEWCEVNQKTVDQISATQDSGGSVTAVGTTSVRALESACIGSRLREFRGSTELFIQPGYRFQMTDQLLTNFHLPGSTLIMLVAAFAGYDLTLKAYRTAVERRYRFYSYGDAMLIQ